MGCMALQAVPSNDQIKLTVVSSTNQTALYYRSTCSCHRCTLRGPVLKNALSTISCNITFAQVLYSSARISVVSGFASLCPNLLRRSSISARASPSPRLTTGKIMLPTVSRRLRCAVASVPLNNSTTIRTHG